MYKLHLCLRYLRSRVMAYFAVFAVSVCVFMMLVVISVMSGFLRKVESAAKGLSGDIIVESTSLSGLGRYDEFIADLKAGIAEVQAASPFIMTYGVLRLPGTDYRQTVQVAGIRMPERSEVTDFADGLHFQKGLPRPDFDPDFEHLRWNVAKDLCGVFKVYARDLPGKFPLPAGGKPDRSVDRAAMDRGRRLAKALGPLADRLGLSSGEAELLMAKLALMNDQQLQAEQAMGVQRPDDLPAFIREVGDRARNDRTFPEAAMDLANRFQAGVLMTGLSAVEPFRGLSSVISFHADAEAQLRSVAPLQARMRDLQTRIEAKEAQASAGGPATRATAPSAGGTLNDLYAQRDDLEGKAKFRLRPSRMILGQGIPGLSYRSDRGEIMRQMMPGQKMSLLLLPLGRGGLDKDVSPLVWTFTVIDDSKTDVSTVDANMVYVPFETLQRLNDMGETVMADGQKLPARCSAIHIKVRGGTADEGALMAVRQKVQDRWNAFLAAHPDTVSLRTGATVKTWRQRQEMIMSSVSAQRTLVVIMFAVISTVAVVLIFVLFYTIVVQKTKDIGVIKAVGGSGWGVAQIFLGYGAAVGLAGSVLGTIGGVIFVRNINPIHDWVGQTFGLKVWNREWFIFDKIPNEVQAGTVAAIVVAAIVAGLIGALLPAAKAGTMQPVEALRYE